MHVIHMESLLTFDNVKLYKHQTKAYKHLNQHQDDDPKLPGHSC